jgi:hypothetical protein
MTVVALVANDYEDDHVLGIFSSYEKAHEAYQALVAQRYTIPDAMFDERTLDDYPIEYLEFTLDVPLQYVELC